MPVLHQRMCTFMAALWILGKIWRCSNQNIEMSCKNKLKLTKLKGLCLNSTDKLAKEWLTYVNSYSETLNSSGRDVISDYEILLSILNAFTVSTEDYYRKCYNVNDAKGLQILYHDCSIILRLEVVNRKYWLI